ncbi:TPA: hypothetical protein ACIT51_002771 [Salmonella enterica subsp. enterica serovar Java]
MKPAFACILCENVANGNQCRIRERHINPDRSLLDNITGPDDERIIFLTDGSQIRAPTSAVKSRSNLRHTPRKNSRGGGNI